MEPKGKLTKYDLKLTQNKSAVYLDVILKDEDGVLWKAHSSSFKFDLKKVEE